MSRLCRLSLAIAVALAVAAPAASAAPVSVSGRFTVGPASDVTLQPLPGGRCLTTLTTTFTFTEKPRGSGLDGSFTADFEITSNEPCDQQPGGQQTFVASGTFEGSVAGVSGSFEFVFRGTIDPEGNAQGQLVVLSGSGDLAGLEGSIQLSGLSGVGGTYSGTVSL